MLARANRKSSVKGRQKRSSNCERRFIWLLTCQKIVLDHCKTDRNSCGSTDLGRTCPSDAAIHFSAAPPFSDFGVKYKAENSAREHFPTKGEKSEQLVLI